MLLKAKLSGEDVHKAQSPSQDKVVSEHQTVASSVRSNTISVASFPSSTQTTVSTNAVASIMSSARAAMSAKTVVSVPSPHQTSVPMNSVASTSQTTISTNSIASAASNKIPPLVPPPLFPSSFINVPVSITQNLPVLNVSLHQNQASFSSPVLNSIPRMAPMQMAVHPSSLKSVTSIINPVFAQNMRANLQPSPIVKFGPPPPPPPPTKSQLSQEVLDAIIRIKNKTFQPAGQSNSSTSSSSQPHQNAQILDTLKNLEALDKEFKKKKM